MTNPIERVLFIGLGAMGEPMATRLADRFDLFVNDVSEERAREVAAVIGVTPVTAAVDVAPKVDVVVLMLPNSAIVERVLIGSGLLDALQPGSLVIDMSSSRPDSTLAMAEAAQEREVDFVDAPVSGGRVRAISGELAIMVGGPTAAKGRARPLLDAMGTSIVDTGAAGTGHAMKALNNLLSATGLLAACEVLVAGAKFGLDPAVMLDVLNNSTGRNQATEVKMAKFVLSRRFDAGFALDLMVKDLRTAAGLIEDVVPEPSVTKTTIAGWIAAQSFLEDPGADHTAVARWVESRSALELEG